MRMLTKVLQSYFSFIVNNRIIMQDFGEDEPSKKLPKLVTQIALTVLNMVFLHI